LARVPAAGVEMRARLPDDGRGFFTAHEVSPMTEFDRPEALRDYTALARIPMHWGEMDAFGHLNNAMYFRYFESSRILFFEERGFTRDGLPGGIGPILASASCRFKAPLRHPDTLISASRAIEIGTDRFTIEHVIFSEKLGRIAALGEVVVVSYDYGKGKKVPLPAEWRELLENA